MDVIINDFSIDGQFKDIEEFLDSIIESILPVVRIMQNRDYEIYKAYDTYSRKLFGDVCIFDFIKSSEYNKYPEISVLRKLLLQFTDNPYWETDKKTDETATYHVEQVGTFSGNTANCLSETLERKGILLSFKHDRFSSFQLAIIKNSDKHHIPNVFDETSFGENLFAAGKIGFSEYLLSRKYPNKIKFAGRNGKYFADEVYDKDVLSSEDVYSIASDFEKSQVLIGNGVLKSRFSDSISHQKITYYEFRCTISDNREFRIYYYLHNGVLVYFNSLNKKTKSLGKNEKDKTVSLIKEYLRNINKA